MAAAAAVGFFALGGGRQGSRWLVHWSVFKVEVLEHGNLPDGRGYEILRLVTPEPFVPAEVVRYFSASLGYEKYRNVVQDMAYWRLYFRESLGGRLAPEVIDHHYL